jgi:hypothetical protein
MQEQSSVFGGAATSLALRYTGKPVSGWGGLVAVMRYLERRGVRRVLEGALPDGRSSPNQIPVVDLVLAFFAGVLTGSRRFAHVERLRSDEVVQTILGLARMPSAMTLTRYFGGLVRSQVEHLSAVLGQFVFGQLKRPALGATLDLDSTVFERYGHQEGSLKGYNPRKYGRPSHHPLLAILAESKLVLHAWLRSGNTASARGVKAFLAETLARVPEDFRFYGVRADSGFFLSEFLEELEQRALPYVIAVRMNPLLRRAVVGIRQWQSFAPGLEAAETSYCAHGWKAPRRLVVVRELLRERPEARGRKLLEVPGYTFHVLVTTLSLDPVQTWRFYNSRAESENRLKELKEDFGADVFVCSPSMAPRPRFALSVSCLTSWPISNARSRRMNRRVCSRCAPRSWSSAPSWVPRVATQSFASGCATAGANASPPCLNVSRRSRFQLWRS